LISPAAINSTMINDKVVVLFMIDFLISADGLSGGTERQIIQIIKRLNRRKFSPILVCLRKYDNSALWDSLNCKIKILDVYSIGSIKGFFGFVSFLIFLIINKVDILQTYFFDSTIYGIPAAKLAGVDIAISWRRDMGFWYDKKLLKWLGFVNRFTKRIIVNSLSIKEFVIENEKFPADLIDIICNGVDVYDIEAQEAIDLTDEFDAIQKEDRIVGIVGNFNRQVKRIDLFIKAAALVAAQRERVKFLVIGGGKFEQELKDLATDLEIYDRLIFTGKRDNVIPYIKNFSIGALTSDSEGFPNVLLEYMACGVASVATDVGGNRDLIQVGKTGILVPRGDPETMARAAIELLDDNQYRERLGRNAKALVKSEYSWDKKIPEMESYYLNLVKNE